MQLLLALATVLATTSEVVHGAACTSEQASVIVETSMAAPWANCTSTVGNASSMMELVPTSAAKITLFCSTPSCTANLDAWIKSFPDCTLDGKSQKETMTTMAATICAVGSTNGGACSPNQLITAGQMFVSPVPAACASATGIPATTTLQGLLNQSATVICNTPCIGAITTAAAALPNCTADGKVINDATPYTKLCTPTTTPKPSNAVPAGVALVSMAILGILA
ncbi:hypothetical protein DYB32_007206 [Aphanomyces invadans]|uniref:Secreted protein n=1 Tax=Aphanomyces invadans TaxID=157072 RepID=A0A418APS9_9STRA|nr:hypothetical protein DYB32_007206 [Aphanomyces invadans]